MPNDSTIQTDLRKGKHKEMGCTQLTRGHPRAKGTGVGISSAAEEEKTSSKSVLAKEINVSLKITQ